jgi:hypothetical protein
MLVVDSIAPFPFLYLLRCIGAREQAVIDPECWNGLAEHLRLE